MRWMIDRRFVRLAVLWLLISLATLAVVASCGGPQGTYQGPHDDAPYYRMERY